MLRPERCQILFQEFHPPACHTVWTRAPAWLGVICPAPWQDSSRFPVPGTSRAPLLGVRLSRRLYSERAAPLVEAHELEVAALTWNVAEARPDAGNALHRWLADLSRDAALAVVALQARATKMHV